MIHYRKLVICKGYFETFVHPQILKLRGLCVGSLLPLNYISLRFMFLIYNIPMKLILFLVLMKVLFLLMNRFCLGWALAESVMFLFFLFFFFNIEHLVVLFTFIVTSCYQIWHFLLSWLRTVTFLVLIFFFTCASC